MTDAARTFDVLVVGGGNAALCAAIAARRAGASVLVLEAAPKFYRGGNTRHTRNMRCAHDAATETLTRPLHGRGVFRRLAARDGGPHRRGAGALHGRRVEGDTRLDAAPGRALPAVAGRHAEPRADQLVLPRRRPGDAECALPHGGGARRRNPVRCRGRRSRASTPACSCRRRSQSGEGHVTVRAATLVAASGGFEANIEWLKTVLGRRRRQFPDPRHAL